MKISDLLERVDYRVLFGKLTGEGKALCTDNRKVQKGDVFICIKGAKFDSHNCVSQLIQAGASLVVVSEEWIKSAKGQEMMPKEIPEDCCLVAVEDTRVAKAKLAAAYYGYPADKLVTVGITGSKGKTTTAHMLASMIQESGYEVGTIGTNGAIIGGQIYELNNTTPDSEEMQMYLAKMVEYGCEYVIIECSSQGLMQHRTGGFLFDYGIFTNIAEGDHVGPNEHASFQEYLHCKSLLLRNSRLGVVNADDVHVKELLDGVTTPILFYGQEGNEHIHRPDYYAYGVQKTFDGRNPGILFEICGALEARIEVNFPGLFNVGNAMASLVVGHQLNLPVEAMQQALRHMSIKGRIDMVYRCDKFSVCVDFAHNGYSTRNLLEALREYRPKRLICIFGADGNRAKSRRYEMGEASGKLADLSIVTSGHNRYESFEQIFEDISIGLSKTTGAYIVIANRKEAIRYALEHVEEGDLITIIGLGHETYQEENGVKYPYSDTEYVLQVIEELQKNKQEKEQ